MRDLRVEAPGVKRVWPRTPRLLPPRRNLSDFVSPFVGHDTPPCLTSVFSQGNRYFHGLAFCAAFVRQDLAAPVSDALVLVFEMKKVPRHTVSIRPEARRSRVASSIASTAALAMT
jgi:hypothetical protein